MTATTAPTKAKLSRWGNSMALRIPKQILSAANLSEEDCIEISASPEGITLKKCAPALSYSLESLLSGVTEENRHAEIAWGKPRGKEAW